MFVWPDLGNLGMLQLVIRALLAGGIRELSNAGGIRGWWSNFILSPRKPGGFFRGARHVTSTSRHPGARQVKSLPLTGTGARHVTSLPSDRGSTHHVVAAYQGTMPSLRLSVGKFLPSPIRPVVSIPSGRFFFPHRFTVFVARTIDTSPPGAFGRNGFHGESA